MQQVVSKPAKSPLTTWVYIDGFNLYYGALNKKGPGRKWLDIESWLKKLLPQNNVAKIKFFTARVTGKYDPDKPARQNLYFRALGTNKIIDKIEGRFLNKKVKIQITSETSITGRIPEEKGTDVNLATHLVNDAHLKKFEMGVVVSNDSDLSEAVRIVAQELKLPVGIINPCMGMTFNKQLTRFAAFKEPVRSGAILKSQFPNAMNDATGLFTKPPSW